MHQEVEVDVLASPSKADLRVRWVIACSRRSTAIRQGDLEAALVESRRIDLLLDQWPASPQAVQPASA